MSMSVTKKRKCHFSDDYTKEWSFIKKGRTTEEAFCDVCNCFLSISHGGKADIKHHISTTNHKNRFTGATTSRSVADFMIKEDTQEELLIAAAELTTAYKVVKHHQSFNSLDCNVKLNAIMYPDSKIAAKQSTARTKATAIVKNILAPHSVSETKKALQDVSYYGVGTDASNHKAEKMFPLLVQYFTEHDGIQQKLLKFDSLKNETSDTISKYCLDTLNGLQIPLDKLIAFCGDNANTNFGGLERRGQCNVFHKLKEELGKPIEGIGCPAHVLHNTVSTAAGMLSVDVEVIVLKIYNYFAIYTVRTEKLKEFCSYVEMNHQTLLSHSRTRWLSLMPAVERILKLWTPLKNFFDAEDRAPKIIANFFKNPMAEIYFLFLHSNLGLFEKNIKTVEMNKISIIEIRKILRETQRIMIERKSTNFIGLQTKMQLNRLKNDNPTSETTTLISKFEEETKAFFDAAYGYLQKWSVSFDKYEVFEWMTLSEIPDWEKIENSIVYLKNYGGQTLNDSCFEQYLYLKSFLEAKLDSEEWKSINSVEEKWIFFFKETAMPERKCELLKLCQYLFAIPAHNATVERVFSLMSAQWTDERNRLLADTVESILQCQVNYNMTCSEFYKYVKGQKELLKKVKSSEKYVPRTSSTN